jgi:hypothetical protein
MRKFLTTILAIGIILPLCTQAAAPAGDEGVFSAAPEQREAADPCGGHTDSFPERPAADCLAHCLSAKGMVSEQQSSVAGQEPVAAWFAAGSDPAGADPDGLSAVSHDDHILRMLLYNRLSGVIMRN